MKILRKYLFALGLAGIGFAGCAQHPGSSTMAAAVVAPGEIGSQMPAFDLKDLRGKELSSDQLRGKVVLIDFWATWCGPCKKEMPGYQKLQDEYGPRGFVVIGFKFDTMADTEDPVKFARRMGVRYPLAIAPDELKEKFGGIEGLPTTMLYDREGILRKKVVGFEYTEAFESVVKQLIQ